MATDGEIDFRKYTREQLDSAVSRMDHERFPINSRNLISEYQRRKVEEKAAAALAAATATPMVPDRMLSAAKAFQVKFQPSTVFVDWLEPSRNDFHLTGSGTVQVDDTVVKVRGRRASYMAGIPLRRTEELGRRYITNVEVQECVVRFELTVPGQKVRHLALWLKSPEEALELSRMLPMERTQDFVPRLKERVEFERLLIAQSAKTPVTWTLVGLCILVYAATALVSDEWLDLDGASLVSMGSDFGPYTTDGDWFRLFTCMFLHGGLLHILFNMWALASFGPLVERLFGSISYATIYLVAGIAASLASISWNPDVNSVGASGAIFGLLGALAAIQVHNDGSIPISVLKPLRRSSLIYIGVALLAGFESSEIDNAAHVGGLLAGYLLGYTLRRPLTGLSLETRAFTRRLGLAAMASCFLIVTGVLVAKQATARLTNEGQYNATLH